MSLDALSNNTTRLQEIYTVTSALAEGKRDVRGTLSGQGDLLDQIFIQLNLLREEIIRRDEADRIADSQGNELLSVMLTMAVGDYTSRATVGEDDTILDALASGLNMLNEELIANRDDRERLQEEVIQMQAAALRELSTPIIPITERVLIMPLIGSIDTQRTQQMIETLLQGIVERQTDVAILDITGVALVDTYVANGLIRAAQAAQLLGTHVVLTGIRPEVAQTLVELDVDLSHIATYGTLQAGVAAVLNQVTPHYTPAKPLDRSAQRRIPRFNGQ